MVWGQETEGEHEKTVVDTLWRQETEGGYDKTVVGMVWKRETEGGHNKQAPLSPINNYDTTNDAIIGDKFAIHSLFVTCWQTKH